MRSSDRPAASDENDYVSVFAEPLAQVESALVYLESITLSLGPGERTTKLADARAALDRVELLATDMESKLRAATDLLAQAEKIVPGLIATSGRFVLGDVAQARQQAAEMEPLMRQMLEHMEFAYYPQTGDGLHLADPFNLMDATRAVLCAREEQK